MTTLIGVSATSHFTAHASKIIYHQMSLVKKKIFFYLFFSKNAIFSVFNNNNNICLHILLNYKNALKAKKAFSLPTVCIFLFLEKHQKKIISSKKQNSNHFFSKKTEKNKTISHQKKRKEKAF